MQQPGRNRRRVEAQLGEDPRDLDAVLQEGLPRLADLPLVGGQGEVEGAGDEGEVGRLDVRRDLDEQHLQQQVLARGFEEGVELGDIHRRGGGGEIRSGRRLAVHEGFHGGLDPEYTQRPWAPHRRGAHAQGAAGAAPKASSGMW